MKYTSAEANKLLKKWNDEYLALLDREERSCEFVASLSEDPESVRPAYDYAETAAQLADLEARIRALKHAINVFNATHTVPEFGMTIDEILVYIPQLTKRKAKLAQMQAKLPKTRVQNEYGRQTAVVDYCYLNYDLSAVQKAYSDTADELARAQLALDRINGAEVFEF